MYDSLIQEQRDIFQTLQPLFSDTADPSTHGGKVMASVMTGIAATLLPEAQTAHKTFCKNFPNIFVTPTYLLKYFLYANTESQLYFIPQCPSELVPSRKI